MKSKSTKLLLSAALTLTSSSTFAIGLYVPYQSAADLGDARAGTAAVARDASTNYANPAGIPLIQKKQFVASAIGSLPYYNFNGTMTNPGFGLSITQSGKPSSNLSGIVPAFHYVQPIYDKTYLGVSLIVPSGLGFVYSEDSIVRYEVVRTTLATTSLTPSIAYELTPKFSVAIGPDILYSILKTKIMVRTQPFTPNDSTTTFYANGIDYAWHAGILYAFNPETRAGVSYRSRATLHFYGQNRVYTTGGLLPARTASNDYKSVIAIAELISASIYHEFNHKWAVEGTVEFMNWSVYSSDRAYNVATPLGTFVNVNTPRNLKNTWFYAVGGSYKPNDLWVLRAGISRGDGATNNGNRQITMPDPDAFSMAVGGHYQVYPHLGLDIGLNHSFFPTVKINHTAPSTLDHISGRMASGQTSVGLQGTWDLV